MTSYPSGSEKSLTCSQYGLNMETFVTMTFPLWKFINEFPRYGPFIWLVKFMQVEFHELSRSRTQFKICVQYQFYVGFINAH